MCRILAGFIQIITDPNPVVPKITSVVDPRHFGTDPDPRIGYPTLEQEGQADLNDVEVAVCCGWTPGRQSSHPRIYATGSPAPNAIWNEKLTSKRVERVAWNFLRTTGTLRYFFVVFDERHFWLMRTDKHSVMVADDILHSHCGLQTCIVMGKKIIA
jgi:hypothetical protein